MRILQQSLIENDTLTGLDRYCQITDLIINGSTENITVKYRIALLSPTGICMKIEKEDFFIRYDSDTNKKYTQLEQSPIGQGIKQILALDLRDYPNFDQIE